MNLKRSKLAEKTWKNYLLKSERIMAMDFFSRKSGLAVSMAGLAIGLPLFFNSSSLGSYGTKVLGLILVLLFLWKFAYFIHERYLSGIAISTVILILGLILGLSIFGTNHGACLGFGTAGVYENSFTDEKKEFERDCDGTGPPWYWEKTNLTKRECYEMDSCKSTERTKIQLERGFQLE